MKTTKIKLAMVGTIVLAGVLGSINLLKADPLDECPEGFCFDGVECVIIPMDGDCGGGGGIDPCPAATGGYISNGVRHGDYKEMYAKIQISTGAILGFFLPVGDPEIGIKWALKATQEYTCDQTNSTECWFCNRYVLE